MLHFYTWRALQPCNDQNRKKQKDSSQKQNQRKATPSHTLLSDTHSLVQRKERGHTNRSSLVRDSVSELGGEAKKKKEKNVKLRESWKHILSKPYMNRVGGKERERRRWLLVGGTDFKQGYSYNLQCKNSQSYIVNYFIYHSKPAAPPHTEAKHNA